MQVKVLAADAFEVVAVMDGDECPAESFLVTGEASTESARNGLLLMLKVVAASGLQSTPSAWSHEADKQAKIFEFIKGPLRLFFFKGRNGQVAVCTGGVRKSRDKADKASVEKAARMRTEYLKACDNNTLRVIRP